MNNKMMELAMVHARFAVQEVKRSSNKVSSANGQNITTVADEHISAILINLLTKESGYPVVTEELSKNCVSVGSHKMYWLVDDIDGSTNFSKGFPYWSVSISFVDHGVVSASAVATAVYEKPVTLYYTCHGEKMYKDGQEVRVSQRSELLGGFLAFDNSYNSEETSGVVERLRMLDPMPWLKNFGSAVLTTAEVASGMWDAHYHWAFKPWDIAAALIMIPNAGGIIIDLETGKPASLATSKAVCGNEKIVNLIIEQTGLV